MFGCGEFLTDSLSSLDDGFQLTDRNVGLCSILSNFSVVAEDEETMKEHVKMEGKVSGKHRLIILHWPFSPPAYQRCDCVSRGLKYNCVQLCCLHHDTYPLTNLAIIP